MSRRALPARTAATEPPLAVTLNADDPISFSTRLAHELAYAWAGLVVDAQVAPTYALAWLEDAARASQRFTFALPASTELARRYPSPGSHRRWR